MSLPNYCQKEDIEDRFQRKVVFFSSNQIPLSFGPTTNPDWWAFLQVSKVHGQVILSSLSEIRVRSEDDAKYIRDAFHEYCDRMHIPWHELDPEEKIPRKIRDKQVGSAGWLL